MFLTELEKPQLLLPATLGPLGKSSHGIISQRDGIIKSTDDIYKLFYLSFLDML